MSHFSRLTAIFQPDRIEQVQPGESGQPVKNETGNVPGGLWLRWHFVQNPATKKSSLRARWFRNWSREQS